MRNWRALEQLAASKQAFMWQGGSSVWTVLSDRSMPGVASTTSITWWDRSRCDRSALAAREPLPGWYSSQRAEVALVAAATSDQSQRDWSYLVVFRELPDELFEFS